MTRAPTTSRTRHRSGLRVAGRSGAPTHLARRADYE